ncbi:hypothetical protein LINPERHAP1_LOCUS27302, partial [Linum perenne]
PSEKFQNSLPLQNFLRNSADPDQRDILSPEPSLFPDSTLQPSVSLDSTLNLFLHLLPAIPPIVAISSYWNPLSSPTPHSNRLSPRFHTQAVSSSSSSGAFRCSGAEYTEHLLVTRYALPIPCRKPLTPYLKSISSFSSLLLLNLRYCSCTMIRIYYCSTSPCTMIRIFRRYCSSLGLRALSLVALL